jgi:hypothetical protein
LQEDTEWNSGQNKKTGFRNTTIKDCEEGRKINISMEAQL